MTGRTIAQPHKIAALAFTPMPGGVLQRKCACGQHTVAGGECAECQKNRLSLQRNTRNPKLQTRNSKPETPNLTGVPPIVHEVLRSPGQPLAPTTAAFMESRFGHDFSQVRIHTDARAAESARAVNALAYTVGQDVVFGGGQYAPSSQDGQKILAHELAHTIQQTNGIRLRSNNLELTNPTDPLEKEAETAAKTIVDGGSFHPIAKGSAHLSREEVRDAGVPLPAGVPEAPEAMPEEEEGVFIESRGRIEKVDPTKVPSGIWWFDGATPTLSNLYPTEATINTRLPASGTFRYAITKGTKIVGIDDGSSVTTSRTVRDDPTVKVKSLGPSSAPNDVEMKIEHTPPGATRTDTFTTQLQVHAPNYTDLLGCSHAAEGAHGYKTVFRMKVFDNFGAEMPYIDANEDFTTGTLEPGVSSEWRAPFTSRPKGHTLTLGDAIFHDEYTASVSGGPPPASMSPRPRNPQTPLGSTRAGTFTHWWYIGSSTPGQGVKVSEHVGTFFADHGQYAGFLSPPFYAVRPVDCP